MRGTFLKSLLEEPSKPSQGLNINFLILSFIHLKLA